MAAPTSNFGSTDVSVTKRWNRRLVVGKAEGVVRVDLLLLDGVHQRLVHHLHAQVLAGLQLGGIWWVWSVMISLAMARVISMISTIGPAAPAVRRAYQRLGDDGVQALGKEALGLLAHVAGQGVDDTVDGLDGTGGVQGAQHEVAGLRRGHGHLDGLGVAQLADQDHVGIFPERRADAFGEARQVRPQLPLDDLGLLAPVDELDRVLEADDVAVLGAVQVVDHRRQRGGLAGAGRAGHQDHPLVVIAQRCGRPAADPGSPASEYRRG